MLRILDANANRLREGLRVVEEAARFALNAGGAAADCKRMRRLLEKGLKRMDRAAGGRLDMAMLQARDSRRDVGRPGSTPDRTRSNIVDVVTANFKRVEEAARVLEEYAAPFDATASGWFERVRYTAYELEKSLLPALSRSMRLADVRLCVIVTESMTNRDLSAVTRAALRGGAQMIQYRNKEIEDGPFAARAERLLAICRRAEVPFIVNDRVDVAAAIEADGVHLGPHDLDPAVARAVLGSDRIIGVSASTLARVRSADVAGADYLGVGAAFPSATKESTGGRPARRRGVEFVRRALEKASLPLFAIGGITERNVGQLIRSGCGRIAVCGAVLGAPDVEKAVRALLRKIARTAR